MRSFILKSLLALTLLLPAGFSFTPEQNVSAAITALDPPTLNSPADGAIGVSTSPTLDVTVTDPEGDPLTVTFYGRPVPGQPGLDFTLIVLPDTQGYTDYKSSNGPAIFNSQTQWIVNNRSSLNIAYVAHVGDVVQHGDSYEEEWQRADAALSMLENPAATGLPDGIPYGISMGNNDGSNKFYNQYFGIPRYLGRSYYGDHYGSNNDNHYSLFSAGGMDFIVIDLRYYNNPDPAVLSWANQLLQDNSSRRAIVVTHHVTGTGDPADFGTPGLAIYEALKGNPNLFLMLGGHISGEGQRQDTFNGNTVYSLLADYQSRSNGGDGLLRMMEFSPANDEIRVKTFSPWKNAYETDADSQFTLPYSMEASSEFQEIGTVDNVTSGSARLTWPGLSSYTEYEWYVTVDDGSQETTGPTWSFTTAAGQNHPPTANDDEYQTNIGEPLTVSKQDLLSNDTDPDSDPLAVLSVSAAFGGYVQMNNGSIYFTPDQGVCGQASAGFNYVVSDGKGGQDTGRVTIDITCTNHHPASAEDIYTASEDSLLELPLTGPGSPAENDTDADGDTLSVTGILSSSGGYASISGSSITFTPAADLCGPAAGGFDYTVSDGKGGTGAGHAQIDIICVNDPPTSADDSYTTNKSLSLSVAAPGVLSNDTDIDRDALEAVLIKGTRYGRLSLNQDGSFTYTPQAGFSGFDSFTYQASDGLLASNAATVNIQVGEHQIYLYIPILSSRKINSYFMANP